MNRHAGSGVAYRRRRGAEGFAALCLVVLLGVWWLTPPAGAQSPGGIQPVFQNGMAQPVYAGEARTRQDFWVVAPVDSDRDGRDDLVHVVVARTASTDLGVKMPVVFQPSPYYAGGNDITNHDVDVELYVPPGKRGRDKTAGEASRRSALVESLGLGVGLSIGPGRYEDYFVPRGFVFVYAESLGSGESTGCPTSGGRNETIGMKAVVDWLNDRAVAYDASGKAATAWWTTGQVGMMGVSYNGTLPNAVASTGVEGLRAIVPIAAISSWYDYYRANGAVIAPGGFQGEDEDVLVEYVLTRENPEVCAPVTEEIRRLQDRVTGDYSDFWAERDYTLDVDKVKAAVLAVHGLNDSNVKTKHVAQWYEGLARQDVPRRIWLHQLGHTDPYNVARDPWLTLLNRWMTRWLWDVENGVELESRAVVQREDRTLVDYADWPDPATEAVTLGLVPSEEPNTVGGLEVKPKRPFGPDGETIVDDASIPLSTLRASAQSPHRLVYKSPVLTAPLRVSGTTTLSLYLSFSWPAANVSAALVDYRADGTSFVVNRGWTDPQNRKWISDTAPIQVGHPPYKIDFDLQPDDYLFPAGSRIGIVLYSSDFEHSLRPQPGTRLHLDTAKSRVNLPVVGGLAAFERATAE